MGRTGGSGNSGDSLGGDLPFLLGVLCEVPRRATYRSEPFIRRSLVRAAVFGLVEDLFLVIRICWGLVGIGAFFGGCKELTMFQDEIWKDVPSPSFYVSEWTRYRS